MTWPALTICPEKGYKSGSDLTRLPNLDEYLNSTYEMTELFSEAGMREIEASGYSVKTTNSMLRGRCYTLFDPVLVSSFLLNVQ